MKISVDEARAFWRHPSQHLFGVTDENLPDAAEYWASGPACLGLHGSHWDGVWMCHVAALPEGWGRLDGHVSAILAEFWGARHPSRIIGWVHSSRPHAAALARRVGFITDGSFPVPDGEITMLGWRP